MSARELREAEKARYLTVNSAVYPDAVERWKKYEELILNKYLPHTFPPHRREQALDLAWTRRDKYRALGKKKQQQLAPRSDQGQGSERAA